MLDTLRFEGNQFLAIRSIPDSQDTVLTAGCDDRTINTGRCAVHVVGRSGEFADRISITRRMQKDSLIAAAAENIILQTNEV